MKRLTSIMMAMTAALLAGSAVFAQSPQSPTPPQAPQRAPRQPVPGEQDRARQFERPEKITLSGTLALDQGRIILVSGGDSYVVTGLRPLIGFVNGLSEGASVDLEGYLREFSPRRNRAGGKSESAARGIHVTRVTLGSKSYDLPARRAGDFGAGRGREHRGWGPGRGRYQRPCRR
ncbi:MAG: alpha/beta hydrolase family protein [Treponema sp.]|jgi:hypothetical protein|nr:alpha/beta hydrolase family protein [Treponema sp.]